MKIEFKSDSAFLPATQDGAVVVLVDKASDLTAASAPFGDSVAMAAEKAAKVTRYAGKAGQKVDLVAPAGVVADRVVFWSVGERAKLSPQDTVELGGAIFAHLHMTGSTSVTVIDDADTADMALVAEGILLRAYRFDRYRTKEDADKKPTLKAATLVADDAAAERFAVREGVARGVYLTRDLTSEPPNVLHPESFAERVRDLEELGIEVSILDEAYLKEHGFNALLAVGQGSTKESRVAIMRWNGKGDDSAPVAFLGKGVTFDTGGISIKPSEGMDQMKWDMGGAGIVTGAMCALAARKAKANVIGVVGLVENMPDGNAQRPGDVVTSLSGQTIEVLNTDAEGRLVLADILWHVKETYKPELMVDLATLTGAMIVALGSEYAGIFSNNDELADRLLAAGAETGDKVWRFPLHKNYDKMIDTPTADMKNIGGRGAGSITAAQFLQRFVGDTPWTHIDVAGVVWSEKNMTLSEKGATGYGVRLLDTFIASHYEAN